MEENEGVVGGTSSRVSSSFAAVAAMAAASSSSSSKERQRFTIELRPGETTIVSWKKLIKESNKSNPPPLPPPDPPTGAHPALESRIAPGQSEESELKDEPPSNRFSAVIEKIERLYVGKQSSDEEELGDVPDDDQYDTEDSFIDDADLDEYFQVDKSTTKHNGFFINRGKLEPTNDPIASPNHQPKKKRRKDSTTRGENDGEHVPNKLAKMGNTRMKAAARTAPLGGNNSSSLSQSLSAKIEHSQNEKLPNQLQSTMVPSKKKSSDPNIKLEHCSSSNINKDTSVLPVEAKDTEKQKTGVIQSRDLGNKLKVARESSDATHQINRDKGTTQLEPQSKRPLNDTDEMELSSKVRQREKNGSTELPDLNFPRSKYPIQTAKTPPLHVKEGSNVRPKGTMLERAIRELEEIVAESRPPTLEVPDADNSSQAVKRRLPREVKQKLAKVARLAQSSQGKISEELINRLMSILGHIVQLKTLKRNLKEMVELGLSAKQEKDDRFQQIKKEVVEMIRMRAPALKSKVTEQRDGTPDDFQKVLTFEERGVIKEKHSMDESMEDKICDLYDLYVEGMDEYKGPQIRKLYVELAELWPNGTMDNHGIKSAVCRAKARKKAFYNRRKDQETIKRRKLSSSPKTEDIARGENSSIAQPRSIQERLTSESSSQILTSPNRKLLNSTTVNQHLVASGRIPNSSSLDHPKQEKIKGGGSSIFANEVRKTVDQALLKKKVKRKPESDSGSNNFRPAKLSLQQGKERQKPHKQDPSLSHKSGLQLAGLPGCERFI